MHLLAIDTSGKQGSITLALGESAACRVLELVALEGGTFSAQLIPQIMALLAKHRLGKKDLGALVVASGPGSFTGLRIGLAAAKGLAEILQTPIASVSLLDAMVADLSFRGRVVAAMDAGREQFYVGIYESEGAFCQAKQECLLTRDELLAAANGSTLVTADSSLVASARERGIDAREITRPQSDVIAKIGWKKISENHITSVEELDANYIRRAVDPA